jgi:Lrp/AsnC family leucine-responsive transcriptional regulator
MAKTPIALDAADRRILRALQRDGRLSVVALAEQIGLSATPCQRRIRRLEASGVIQGYVARVEPAAIGLSLQAFVQVSLASHAEDVVERFHASLAALPEVLGAWAMSGEMDYLLLILAPDMAAFGDFATRRLLRLPGVKETRSSFILDTLKPVVEVPV